MSGDGAMKIRSLQKVGMSYTKLMTGAIATAIVVLALMATFQT